jgi:hypothetical protein
LSRPRRRIDRGSGVRPAAVGEACARTPEWWQSQRPTDSVARYREIGRTSITMRGSADCLIVAEVPETSFAQTPGGRIAYHVAGGS